MDIGEIKGLVDFGILTIREDELRAVLRRFRDKLGDGLAQGRRKYNLRRLDLGGKDGYTLAIVRCIEQGNGEALAAARDLLEDLAPRWLLVVGIAGATPAYEFSLGDVVVSTRIIDFSVEALLKDGSYEHAATGGPVPHEAAIVAANLAAMEEELGEWSSPESIGVPRPAVDLASDNFYGDDEWRTHVQKTLQHHFGGAPRPPTFTTGALAVSDRLVKEAERVQVWLKAARQFLAIEMESGGVHRAAYGRTVPVPFLAIRGISDVVGFKREHAWIEYACNTAAAFTRAFLLTRPIPPRARASEPVTEPAMPRDGPPPLLPRAAGGLDISTILDQLALDPLRFRRFARDIEGTLRDLTTDPHSGAMIRVWINGQYYRATIRRDWSIGRKLDEAINHVEVGERTIKGLERQQRNPMNTLSGLNLTPQIQSRKEQLDDDERDLHRLVASVIDRIDVDA